MKSILVSIKPEWVAKILNGEKTIEIRKTMPKCDLPIDVYIYCTKDNHYKDSLYEVDKGGYDVDYYVPSEPDFILNGKVVAKFTLNKVEEITNRYCKGMLIDSCLTNHELNNYLGNCVGYAWHISNLVIFDKPKELSEFYKVGYGECAEPQGNVREKVIANYNNALKYQLTRVPTNYCYVEVEQ
jgi:predicted transcriptional regulator